eukprot:1188681-Rhodomonas_salina.1
MPLVQRVHAASTACACREYSVCMRRVLSSAARVRTRTPRARAATHPAVRTSEPQEGPRSGHAQPPFSPGRVTPKPPIPAPTVADR